MHWDCRPHFPDVYPEGTKPRETGAGTVLTSAGVTRLVFFPVGDGASLKIALIVPELTRLSSARGGEGRGRQSPTRQPRSRMAGRISPTTTTKDFPQWFQGFPAAKFQGGQFTRPGIVIRPLGLVRENNSSQSPHPLRLGCSSSRAKVSHLQLPMQTSSTTTAAWFATGLWWWLRLPQFHVMGRDFIDRKVMLGWYSNWSSVVSRCSESNRSAKALNAS